MWDLPSTLDSPDLINMARSLRCNWIGAVPVVPNELAIENMCHSNVSTYISTQGGTKLTGYYFIKGFGVYQAIKHSVWKSGDKIIDITPYKDNREYIVFGLVSSAEVKLLPNCYNIGIDKYLKQEYELMYYVYQLVDPRNNMPFYIGKGSNGRAESHLKKIPSTRNVYKENKIKKIRDEGLEPIIEYVSVNIIDEDLAYDMEAEIISHYGRKGYEENGILTNICKDSRPPNHKGKTYEDIYGIEKAKAQKQLRSKLQKERGGYGPKKHSKATKRLLSERQSGKNNPMYGHTQTDETKKKISDKAKLRTGKHNKKSHVYKLTSPNGNEFNLVGGELSEFCKNNNLSFSTLRKQIQQDSAVPKYGKTKNWKLARILTDANI